MAKNELKKVEKQVNKWIKSTFCSATKSTYVELAMDIDLPHEVTVSKTTVEQITKTEVTKYELH